MSSSLEAGFAALRDGDIASARRLFGAALAEEESGRAFEGLGEALYLAQDYPAAAHQFERAYSLNRKDGDTWAAGRAARTAGWITGNVLGDWAVQNGWFRRSRAILETAGEDTREYGWVQLFRAMTEPDAQRQEARFREAVEIGRRFGDPDIEFEALGHLGGVMIMTGRVEEGMVLFDEALAAVCAGELNEISISDSIFCGFFWACELTHDVRRAEQWMRAARDLMKRRNVIAAFCRAHYGGILTAAGRWSEAESELIDATKNFDSGMPERRAAAMIRLADLRVRQGRLEEATVLLEGLDQHPDAVRTVADLHLARGETALARDLLERSSADPDDSLPNVGESTMVGPLLSLLVDVYLEEERFDQAERSAQRLHRLAGAQRGPYLKAAAALADGRICVATGRGDARGSLHEALEGFARAGLPLELARTRLEMARASGGSSLEVAIVHAKTALDEFERLDAKRYVDSTAALLRSLGAPQRTGPKGTGTLTKREAEILALIGAGLSNPEIGDRLFITRKTVEHHVGSLLSKLGLRNRAEAAAYATREKISP